MASIQIYPSAYQIPSQTGFHIKLKNTVPVVKSSMYLDCQDASAAEMSAAYHMMERALRIKDQLQLQTLVCVYDQTTYANCGNKTERTRKIQVSFYDGYFPHPSNVSSCYWNQIRRCWDERHLYSNQVVADSSVDAVLRGKQNRHAIQIYKIFWELLWRVCFQRSLGNVMKALNCFCFLYPHLNTVTLETSIYDPIKKLCLCTSKRRKLQ